MIDKFLYKREKLGPHGPFLHLTLEGEHVWPQAEPGAQNAKQLLGRSGMHSIDRF